MSSRTFDDETVMAFADGELDAGEAARVRAAMAGDDLLRARIRAFEASRRVVRHALAPLAELPLPPALEVAVRVTARRAGVLEAVVPLSRATAVASWRRVTKARWALPLAASLALVLGGLGGYGVGRDGGSTSTEAVSATLTFEPMAAAFDELTAGEQRSVDGGEVRLVGSFRTASGLLCREAQWSGVASAYVVVACHGEAGWRPRFVQATAPRGYAPASGDEALDLWLDEVGVGPTLTPEAERLVLDTLR